MGFQRPLLYPLGDALGCPPPEPDDVELLDDPDDPLPDDPDDPLPDDPDDQPE